LELEIDGLNRRVLELSTARANLETSLSEQEKTHQDKIEILIELRGEIEKNFKNIASDSLKANESSFLNLANEVFQKHKEAAATEVESKAKTVDALVAPIVQMLNSYQEQIGEIEKARQESTGALSNELKQVIQTQNSVRAETAKLVNALRAAPKTRGRWGEHTLRKVIELSGLSAYCDFTVEQTIHSDAGATRPDVIIRLPGDRMLVVDAKTSLSAYLDAVECHDEVERDRHLDLHASQIRNHVKQLGGKSYWDGLRGTPDFVVMFVPGDNFYAAAAERDPDVFEFAAAQRVLIVTPATLIALAKAVAYGWRQEKIAENTRVVHELGRDLYRRLLAMSAHISGMGKSLSASVTKYNDFIGSFESSVLPQARRFNEMEVRAGPGNLNRSLSGVSA
jgi:DNA recombination protein RmuC